MSRIDVVKGERKGKFRVLVNYVQFGVELSSPQLANNHAKTLKDTHYPTAELHLAVIIEQEKVTA